MKLNKKDLLLYAVTDRAWIGDQTLYQQVEAALKGGATCIQLREKDMDEEAFLSEAIELKKLCTQYNVPFIVNDNVDIAIKSDADGIHVGQDDMEAGKVRHLTGKNMIVGVSVQTVAQAKLAESRGASYLGVGTIFTTSTKPDAAPVSLTTLKAICNSVSIPVVAIGGIYKHNLMELSNTCISGVALVSAIFASHNIEAECKILKELSRRMVDSCL